MAGTIDPNAPVGYPGADAFLSALSHATPDSYIYAAIGAPPSTPVIEYAFPLAAVTIGGLTPLPIATMYTTDKLNVRDKPTTAGKLVGTLIKGAKVQVQGESQADGYTWRKLVGGTLTGYVADKFLTATPPVP